MGKKNSTARTISAGVELGTAVGGSDLTNLSNSINAYSAETGVVAVLSADKATVYLTQDEGHDIILTDLDWADVGDDESHSLQVTGMDSRFFDTDGTTELLSGSAVSVYDKLYDDSDRPLGVPQSYLDDEILYP